LIFIQSNFRARSKSLFQTSGLNLRQRYSLPDIFSRYSTVFGSHFVRNRDRRALRREVGLFTVKMAQKQATAQKKTVEKCEERKSALICSLPLFYFKLEKSSGGADLNLRSGRARRTKCLEAREEFQTQ